jgi:hypothetical protein
MTSAVSVSQTELNIRVSQLLSEQPGLAQKRAAASAKLSSMGLATTEIQMGLLLRGPKRANLRKATHLLGQLTGLAVPALQAASPVPVQLEDIGFIVADSWTDGDDSTWEGTFWGHFADIDTEFSLSFQVAIPAGSEDGPPTLVQNWGGTVSNQARGLVPISDDLVRRSMGLVTRTSLVTEPPPFSLPTKASSNTVCECSLLGGPSGAVSDCMLQNALGESWEACAVAAIGCAFGGPGWVVCVTGWCGGSIAVQLADELWDFGWRCFLPE